MKTFILIVFILSTNHIAFSQEETESKDGPCKKLIDACKSADYAKGEAKQKKSLFKDCLQPLLAEPSQSVPGVQVDKALIQACREKKIKRKTK